MLASYLVRNLMGAAMPIVTVSDKGQIVIPAEIRHQLGIVPGCQLEFRLEGNTIRAEVRRQIKPSSLEEGYGMLVCSLPGPRHLADFDVAAAMKEVGHDRG